MPIEVQYGPNVGSLTSAEKSRIEAAIRRAEAAGVEAVYVAPNRDGELVVTSAVPSRAREAAAPSARRGPVTIAAGAREGTIVRPSRAQNAFVPITEMQAVKPERARDAFVPMNVVNARRPDTIVSSLTRSAGPESRPRNSSRRDTIASAAPTRVPEDLRGGRVTQVRPTPIEPTRIVQQAGRGIIPGLNIYERSPETLRETNQLQRENLQRLGIPVGPNLIPPAGARQVQVVRTTPASQTADRFSDAFRGARVSRSFVPAAPATTLGGGAPSVEPAGTLATGTLAAGAPARPATIAAAARAGIVRPVTAASRAAAATAAAAPAQAAAARQTAAMADNAERRAAERDAVREFQRERGITEDGIVGPETRGAMAQRGSRDTDYVRDIQSRLNSVAGTSLAVDGSFGPRTDAAVRAFQRDHGLTVDGVVGPQTAAALRAEERQRKAEADTANEEAIRRYEERRSEQLGMTIRVA